MGIYIEGMKLPQNFVALVVHSDGAISIFDQNTGAFQEIEEKAVEIKKHGRLLDENDICEIIKPVMEAANKKCDTLLERMCTFLLSTLTITKEKIPADKEDL